MGQPDRRSRRRLIGVLAGILVVMMTVSTGILWLLHMRRVEDATFQLRAVALAMAAYMEQFDGCYPDSLEPLERAGIIHQVSARSFVVDADPIPPFHKAGPLGLQVDIAGTAVGWSGKPVDASGVLVKWRRFRSGRLDELAEYLTTQLHDFATARRNQAER